MQLWSRDEGKATGSWMDLGIGEHGGPVALVAVHPEANTKTSYNNFMYVIYVLREECN